MLDERAFINQIEAADVGQFADLLAHPTKEQEKVLRTYFGDHLHRRLHSLSVRYSVRPQGRTVVGNVVVIPDLMGSNLTAYNRKDEGELIWLNARRLAEGRFALLRLTDDGRADYNNQIEMWPTGLMKRHYGELLLFLAQRWQVRAFAYDWRKDVQSAAAELEAKLTHWFNKHDPVHLVAHGMGGLVAQVFIRNAHERWLAMDGGAHESNPHVSGEWQGGRLIMLGTPNRGSFAALQMLVGLGNTVKRLQAIYNEQQVDLLDILRSFPSLYQLLPWQTAHVAASQFDAAGRHNAAAWKARAYGADEERQSEQQIKQPSLFETRTYQGERMSQRHLSYAPQLHDMLQEAIGRSGQIKYVDPSRMIYIAGCGYPTLCNIRDTSQLTIPDQYDLSDGDGFVAHGEDRNDGSVAAPGLLVDAEGKPLPSTYYAKETHGGLVSNLKILHALDELLDTGETSELSSSYKHLVATHDKLRQAGQKKVGAPRPDTSTGQPASEHQASNADQRTQAAQADPEDLSLLEVFAHQHRTRIDAHVISKHVSYEERMVEESLTRDILRKGFDNLIHGESKAPFETASIEIKLVFGHIEEVPYGIRFIREDSEDQNFEPLNADDTQASGPFIASRPRFVPAAAFSHDDPPPVDAIAVGHYLGVRPQYAELALDKQISAAVQKQKLPDQAPQLERPDLLVTQYTERGIIRGDLGQPFFLNDPRVQFEQSKHACERVIAFAGMGLPGRFGIPEMTVLARELCWSLGRMGKSHLVTVLIGAGEGSLSVSDAVSSWMRGVKHAITGTMEDQGQRLQRITFVEYDPRRIKLINNALMQEQSQFKARGRLDIDYTPWSDQDLEGLRGEIDQRVREETEREFKQSHEANLDPDKRIPIRITVSLHSQRKVYRFGAITETASIPEREIPLNPDLVRLANDELAAEWDVEQQVERGRFLGGLLVPADLRTQLSTDAPVVMLLDDDTARIHWEAIAHSPQETPVIDDGSHPGETSGRDNRVQKGFFLGIDRGLTRQLRTTLAPPPEPPPPPRRILRVLIVADPAEDAPLPGAQAEGVEVAELMESYNKVYESKESANRIEVVSLFGPREATITMVLRHLMLRSYDVLHFAGHCTYVPDDPPSSGWIFTGGERLTANELRRIDRIPKFVFSNACESGVTPDRAEDRSVDLAPSFAQSFFERGVANFVCTAWPINDAAARCFAVELYAALLGLARKEGGSSYIAQTPEPMYVAMTRARRTVAELPLYGIRTWAAYQHYGNPFLRFFAKQRDQKS